MQEPMSRSGFGWTIQGLVAGLLLCCAGATTSARGDDAADCLDELQGELDAALTSAAEAVASLLFSDREAAAAAIADALTMAQTLKDDAFAEATTTRLGKAAASLQKAATSLVAGLEKAQGLAAGATGKNKPAIAAVLRAINSGIKFKLSMSKVETAGPLVIVQQAKAKLQKKPGMAVPFQVNLVGGGEVQAEVTNIGGSTGRVVDEALAGDAGSAFSATTGADGGVARIAVTAGGRSSCGFVFNLGPFVPDANKPKALPTEKVAATLPQEVANPEQWTIVSGVHDKQAGNATGTEIKASSEVAHLILAVGPSGTGKLMALHAPGQGSLALTAETTAVALAILTPALVRIYHQDPEGTVAKIKSLPQYGALVDWVAAHFQEDYLSVPATGQLVGDLASAAFEALYRSGAARTAMRMASVSPATRQSWLLVTKSRQTSEGLGLTVTNGAARWVGAHLDATAPASVPDVDDYGLLPAASQISLIPPSYTGATSAGLFLPAEHTGAQVRCYSLGADFSGAAADPLFLERFAFPALLSAVDSFLLPALELIIGVKDFKELFINTKGHEFPETFRMFLWRMRQSQVIQDALKGFYEGKANFVNTIAACGIEVANALLANGGERLLDFLVDMGIPIVTEVGVAIASYFVPVVGQVWFVAKMTVAAVDLLVSAIDLATTKALEVFTIVNANDPPLIQSGPSANPASAEMGQAVGFSVSASDPDGGTLSYSWDFGDGAAATGASTSHTYTSAGIFSVIATVSDSQGASTTGSVTVTISGGGSGGTVATPTFNPAGGTYSSAQSVTISCSTSGATIYYTMDGSTPTTSSTVYSAAISVSASKTIKALGAKSGMTNSAEASATYTISGSGGGDTLDCGGGVTMQLVLVNAGTFTMGSPDAESGRAPDEGPQHQVTISKAFYMGKYEVTQAQYQAVISSNPSYYPGDLQRPVESVSWNSAQTFCQQLSNRTGRTVRLPTEAQWEYACRAGTTTRFYSGDPDAALDGVGWYYNNSSSITHPVGQKTANAWGLYDMHGNVWEWCQDWYGAYSSGAVTDPQGPGSGTSRVLRGGSWGDGDPGTCRSARRTGLPPDFSNERRGFRVVVVPSTP